MNEFLKDTLRANRGLFITATAMTIILKLSSILPALLLGQIIDSVTTLEDADASRVSMLLVLLCAATVFQSIAHPLQTYQLVSLIQTTLKAKSIDWTGRMLRKEFEQFSALRLGGLIKSLERGITAHEKFLTFVITSGFPLMIEAVLIACIFSYMGGIAPFLIITCLSAAYLYVYRDLVRWRQPYLLAVNAQEDQVSSKLFETLASAKSIKLEQACDSAPQPLYAAYEEYARAATRVAGTGAVLGSIKILYLGISVAALLAWGMYDRLSPSPQLTTGELIALFSISGMLVNNISGLAEAYRTLDQFFADKKTLQQALSLDALGESKGNPFGESVLRLELAAIPCVTDSPLSFNARQSVAITGPSGGGKTTLMETLAGTVISGRRYLSADGAGVASSCMENYLERVRYCPQHPTFLEGPFCHSVLFGREATPLVTRAAEALMLQELMENRFIAESARNISGGEAKRLSLLRLLNRPGDFNLFDEPTASLDKEMAARVWDIIFSSFNQRGLICVTHDLTALRRFDRVIVIKQGKIIADGPWRELRTEVSVTDALKESLKTADSSARN